MTRLADLDRKSLADMLDRIGADGWLLFDFHGCNPVARQILPGGMATRRLFVWVPRAGAITAVVHRIEMQPFEGFEGEILPYARHTELHAALERVVKGKTVAMEVSPRDAVPYLDRIPWGVVDLLQSLGARVVSSAGLVTRFAATWTEAEIAEHEQAAALVRAVALEALADAVQRGGTGYREAEMQGRVVAALEARGLTLTTPPIVGFGPNAAMPHYEPHPGADRALARDEVVLLDLWAGMRPGGIFADQTWMGFSGHTLPAKVAEVWEIVRNARDAGIAAIDAAVRNAGDVPGFLGDRAARGVIEAAGYGEFFVHRTGHSIDHDLHGSGPHLDDYETHDDRSLLPGCGCSVEPGIYLPGEFGVRSEINLYWGKNGVVVTPHPRQQDVVTLA